MPTKREAQNELLRTICEDFIKKNRITCPESTAEDRVYQNAPELVEKIANAIGYLPTEDEEEEDDNEH